MTNSTNNNNEIRNHNNDNTITNNNNSNNSNNQIRTFRSSVWKVTNLSPVDNLATVFNTDVETIVSTRKAIEDFAKSNLMDYLEKVESYSNRKRIKHNFSYFGPHVISKVKGNNITYKGNDMYGNELVKISHSQDIKLINREITDDLTDDEVERIIGESSTKENWSEVLTGGMMSNSESTITKNSNNLDSATTSPIKINNKIIKDSFEKANYSSSKNRDNPDETDVERMESMETALQKTDLAETIESMDSQESETNDREVDSSTHWI
ncbi:hypothetical protein ACTFIV_008295 [Dictyostelium citrinum]